MGCWCIGLLIGCVLLLNIQEVTAARSRVQCTPSSVTIQWTQGDPDPSYKTINLVKSSGDTSSNNWRSSSAESWLEVTPSTGTFFASKDNTRISLDTKNAPAPGTYKVTLLFSLTGASSGTVIVTVEIYAPCNERTSCSDCLATDECGYCMQNNQCLNSSTSSNCSNLFPSTCPIPCANTCVNGECDYHRGRCNCSLNYYGSSCNSFCTSQLNCSSSGTCTNQAGQVLCDCDNNYYGANCSKFCEPIANCSNRGVCAVDGSCQCTAPYYGDSCEFVQCPADCSGHGTCNNITGVCTCNTQYYTSSCSVFCDTNVTCSSHGTCSPVDGTCQCDTTNGWYGTSCNAFCDQSTTCSSHGTCNVNGACSCNTGYYTGDCSVFCNFNTTCNSNGMCSNAGKCLCSGPYFGDTCLQKMCEDYQTNTSCRLHGQCNFTTGLCTCQEEGYNCLPNSYKIATSPMPTCHKCKTPFWTRKNIYIVGGVGGGVAVIIAVSVILKVRSKRRGYASL